MSRIVSRFCLLIFFQPRYLLTSLASNDLAIGLLVTPFGVLPAVYQCWPYSDIVCQIQVRSLQINGFINIYMYFYYVFYYDIIVYVWGQKSVE